MPDIYIFIYSYLLILIVRRSSMCCIKKICSETHMKVEIDLRKKTIEHISLKFYVLVSHIFNYHLNLDYYVTLKKTKTSLLS